MDVYTVSNTCISFMARRETTTSVLSGAPFTVRLIRAVSLFPHVVIRAVNNGRENKQIQ